MAKTKNKQQVIDLNQTMSIMTLNITGLNALIKSRDYYIEFKKPFYIPRVMAEISII